MISDTWIESARYLTTLLMNDRQQINSKHRQTLSFGDYNTSLPTSKQSDTASPFMVLLGQVVLTSLISHYPVPLPQQDRDLLFSRQHWWIRHLTAPRKPSAKLWDAERTVCLWVVVVTSKPQCPLVQSNGVSWTIRLSDQCEASFFFPAVQGAPCFSQHLIVINLSGMAVRWKWRNGLPITASLLSDCLVNEGLSAGLTAPQHTGFSLGGKKPVLKCVLKIRKGSKVTHFFYLPPFKRRADMCPGLLGKHHRRKSHSEVCLLLWGFNMLRTSDWSLNSTKKSSFHTSHWKRPKGNMSLTPPEMFKTC